MDDVPAVNDMPVLVLRCTSLASAARLRTLADWLSLGCSRARHQAPTESEGNESFVPRRRLYGEKRFGSDRARSATICLGKCAGIWMTSQCRGGMRLPR